MAGITVNKPIDWKGCLSFGKDTQIKTTVDFMGRKKVKESSNPGGIVIDGCSNVDKLTIENAFYHFTNSTLKQVEIKPESSGSIQGGNIDTLKIDNDYSMLYISSLTVKETAEITNTISTINSSTFPTLKLSQSSVSMNFTGVSSLEGTTCKITARSSGISRSTFKDSDLDLSSLMSSSINLSSCYARIFRGQLNGVSSANSIVKIYLSAAASISSRDRSVVEIGLSKVSSATNNDRCIMRLDGCRVKSVTDFAYLWLSRTELDSLKYPSNSTHEHKPLSVSSVGQTSHSGPERTIVPDEVCNSCG